MEENFKDLLDQYWNDEEVNEKLNNDLIEEEEEQQENNPVIYDSRIDSPFNVADEISINDFINEYLKIKGDYTKFRHYELRNMDCPYVIGVANEYADNNPDFVKKKKYLLIVIDRNGNRGTYVNPVIAHEFFDYDYEEAEKIINNPEHEHVDEFISELRRIKAEYKAYQEFFNILRETKKITKFKKIEKYENILGDEENDKHKGK